MPAIMADFTVAECHTGAPR